MIITSLQELQSRYMLEKACMPRQGDIERPRLMGIDCYTHRNVC